jgi:hypothetical protein
MSPAIRKVKVSTFLLIAVPLGVLIIIVLAITLPRKESSMFHVFGLHFRFSGINRSLPEETGIFDENDVDDEDEEEGQYTPDCPTSKICTNELCQRASDYFMSSINFSVNPCDDFYNFTCGRLQGLLSPIENATRQMQEAAKKILTESDNDKDPLPLQTARRFYQSCSGLASVMILRNSTIFSL